MNLDQSAPHSTQDTNKTNITQPNYQYDSKQNQSLTDSTTSSSNQPPQIHNSFVHKLKTLFLHKNKDFAKQSAHSTQVLSEIDTKLRNSSHEIQSLKRSLLHYERLRSDTDSALLNVLIGFQGNNHNPTVCGEKSRTALTALTKQVEINQQYGQLNAGLVHQLETVSMRFNTQYKVFRSHLKNRKIALRDYEYYGDKVGNLQKTPKSQNVSHSTKFSRNMAKLEDSRKNFLFYSEQTELQANSLWKLKNQHLLDGLQQFLQQMAGLEMQNNVFSQLVAHGLCESVRIEENKERILPMDFRSMESQLVSQHDEHVQIQPESRAALNVQPPQQPTATTESKPHELIQEDQNVQVLPDSEMIRSEERLRVRYLRYPVATMRIKKVLKTELVTLQVEVRKEDLEIETIPVAEKERSNLLETNATQQKDTTSLANISALNTTNANEQMEQIFILREERPRVLMEWYPVEKVSVSKLSSTASQMLEMDLKKEKVKFSENLIEKPDVGLGLTGDLNKERMNDDKRLLDDKERVIEEPGVKDENFYAPIVQ